MHRIALYLIVSAFLMTAGTPAVDAYETALPPLFDRIGGIIENSPSWDDWKANFLSADGRVVDTGNGSISHSEGQGYGMLLAVAASDRPAFDLLWAWTRWRLGPKPSGLFAWRWSPDSGAVSDRNNATDGDILIAWALGEAADLWRDVDLRDAGAAVANAVAKHVVVDRQPYGPILLPGAYGFDDGTVSDGPVVNPSYWIFPAFRRFTQLTPSFDWGAVERTGLSIIADATTDGMGPADWLSLADRRPQPARKFEARFGFDALRVPLYLALAGYTDLDAMRRMPADAKGMPIKSLRTGATTSIAGGDGYVAVAGLIRCAADRTPYPRALTKPKSVGDYYSSTLRMLAQLAALRDPRSCLSGDEALALRPNGWRPVPATLPSEVAAIASAAKTRAADVETSVRHASEVVAGEAGGTAPIVVLVAFACAAFAFFVAFALRKRRGIPGRLHVPADPAIPQAVRSAAAIAPPFRAVSLALESGTPDYVSTSGQQVRAAPPPAISNDPGRHLLAHVHVAARASVQFNQYVGVIVLSHCGQAQRTTSDLAKAISAVRATARTGDFVGAIGPTEIGVCLALLRDKSDLDSVAARIEEILVRAFGADGGSAPFTSVRTLIHKADDAARDAIEFLRTSTLSVAPAEGSALPAPPIEPSASRRPNRRSAASGTDALETVRRPRRRVSATGPEQTESAPAATKVRKPIGGKAPKPKPNAAEIAATDACVPETTAGEARARTRSKHLSRESVH